MDDDRPYPDCLQWGCNLPYGTKVESLITFGEVAFRSTWLLLWDAYAANRCCHQGVHGAEAIVQKGLSL